MTNTKRAAKNLAQLVALFANIETLNDINQACAEIDRSFNAERITAKDHENLFAIIDKMSYRKG